MRNSKLDKLYQSGCAKLMLPKTYGEMTEAVLLIPQAVLLAETGWISK